MIGIEGQSILSFKVGDLEDFIDQPDLAEFLIVEQAGNTLPEFRLSFYTTDDKILSVLNEGNDIEVVFGESFKNSYSASLTVVNADMMTQGNGKRGIVVTGLYAANEYISNKRIAVTEELSGVEAIIERVRESAQFIIRTPGQPDPTTNIEKSEDKMKWVQPNMPDRKFVSDTLLHSYIQDSFIVSGISSDGRFIIKDMKTLLGEDFKWKFTSSPDDDEVDIAYDPSPKIQTQTGFNNYLIGYGRKNLIYNLEDGSSDVVTADSTPLLALTRDLARKATMERRFHSIGMQSDNVHTNYHQAAIQNLTGSIVSGNIKVKLSFSKFFKPVRILDLVMFKERALNATTGEQTSEYTSGLYTVSKVSRVWTSENLVTSVEFCRESFNQVKGDLQENTELEKSFFTPENLPEDIEVEASEE